LSSNISLSNWESSSIYMYFYPLYGFSNWKGINCVKKIASVKFHCVPYNTCKMKVSNTYILRGVVVVNLILLVYRDGQFYWWRKPESMEKTTDLS
jgi:hypothetical protein